MNKINNQLRGSLEFKFDFVVVQQPYIMARLKTKFADITFFGIGFAKCNPIDEWNEDFGYRIASGRAKADIVRQINHFSREQWQEDAAREQWQEDAAMAYVEATINHLRSLGV